MDEFKSSVRVRAAGKEQALVYARGHQFEVGAPVHFDEQYDSVTALEYVLGAVGADVANLFQSLCRRSRLDFDDIEVVVQGELGNPLVYLGVVGEEGNPGLERLRLKAYVASLEQEEALGQVWEEMLKRSPLVRTLQSTVKLELEMKAVM